MPGSGAEAHAGVNEPPVCVRESCRWPSLCPREGYCYAERMEKGAQAIDRDRKRVAKAKTKKKPSR